MYAMGTPAHTHHQHQHQAPEGPTEKKKKKEERDREKHEKDKEKVGRSKVLVLSHENEAAVCLFALESLVRLHPAVLNHLWSITLVVLRPLFLSTPAQEEEHVGLPGVLQGVQSQHQRRTARTRWVTLRPSPVRHPQCVDWLLSGALHLAFLHCDPSCVSQRGTK